MDRNSEIVKEAADMLKQKRKEAHLTQKEVAKMVGINLTTYGQIERGKVPFLNKGATIFMKICEVLDILPYAMFKSLISKIENKNLS